MVINPKFEIGQKIIFKVKSHHQKHWSVYNGGIVISYIIDQYSLYYDIRYEEEGRFLQKLFNDYELMGANNG